ncbi:MULTISPECIES: YheV family putative zinc ribbon protein [unclassified Brenneria]|uniref:YheV family putative zinc ribbon protein n=1 Tax=unclassified Brenneria TaxID=2634434 RepID=UPI001553A46C|nr:MULTISPECIES: YheV family putative zinc ribbon protein [unclassified Brenneria]MBJ7222938.1 YheV family putative metal-binding protein [Brenneria sp. L3-3C-1]MEE3644177.1 YheV family putative zinc ribbon protein [Brenneria sp. L3_3C_1]MEE3652401.1 YheV family putative zinc ribbon protein [Brenneria sp. HEZEL_4_2_4]NPD02358.1 YheV family putative metal-binding protein [Brenneria sp. hezel4-2-4]
MRKRFIAGAVCPKCQTQDTLAVGHENQTEVVVCVKCGYQQSRTDESATTAGRPADNIIGIFHPE